MALLAEDLISGAIAENQTADCLVIALCYIASKKQ
jgi:hypothetical protein